jgi:hypothetical protein
MMRLNGKLGGWPNITQQMTLERQNETANELKYGSISVRT